MNRDVQDHPVIRNLERTGHPDGQIPKYPICPVCGAECETVQRDKDMEIVGCDVCLDPQDAWETDECFPDE